VRDVKYDDSAQYVATLSADATLKLWDPHRMHVVDTVALKHDKELVSLAVRPQLTAVGSASHVSLLDVRCTNGWVRAVTRLAASQRKRTAAGRVCTRAASLLPPVGRHQLRHASPTDSV
jgi:hypothetical protein